MNKIPDHETTFQKLCDDLSTDIDAELCEEVKAHISDCPECKIYVDTLKQTVYLYRTDQRTQESDTVPEEVTERLFRVLNLDEIRKKYKGGSQ